jgi:hypothetical protein
MAFAASSASAAEWLILNAKGEVKTANELNVSFVGEVEPKTHITMHIHFIISFGILCNAPSLKGAKLVGGGAISSGGKVVFSGCTVVEEPSGKALSDCTVSNPGGTTGTIESNEGKGQLQSNGEILIESNKTVIEGTKTVGVLAELKFGGLECPLKSFGTQPIKGVLWFKDCEGKAETHLVKHLIVESTAHGHTWWMNTDNAEHLETSISGSVLVFLAGEHEGLPWGVMLP